MDLDLKISHSFIRNKLHAMGFLHLDVRTQGRSLVIYSIEPNEEAIRAVLTRLDSRQDFVLSIANHRGKWQLVPAIGPLQEMMDMLTDELAFTLAFWPDVGPYRVIQ
ncbi:hypothetical protein [Cohnella cellulosilytica]|uniref:Uncharacterized protein n=1 Tax=Cohnella cellulosilytica TaxID=986710 RepID=A0ABW2F5P8_9BACL